MFFFNFFFIVFFPWSGPCSDPRSNPQSDPWSGPIRSWFCQRRYQNIFYMELQILSNHILRNCLMVSAPYSGADIPGSSLGRVHCVGQGTLLSQCLSSLRCINGYRRNSDEGRTLRWTSIPSTGEVEIVLAAHAFEIGINSGSMRHLARGFPFQNRSSND